MDTDVGNLCATISVELLQDKILGNCSQRPTNPHHPGPSLCKVSGLQASTLLTKTSLVTMCSLQLVLHTVYFLVNRIRLVVEMLHKAKLAMDVKVRLSPEVMSDRIRLVVEMEVMLFEIRLVVKILLHKAKLAMDVKVRLSPEVMSDRIRLMRNAAQQHHVC